MASFAVLGLLAVVPVILSALLWWVSDRHDRREAALREELRRAQHRIEMALAAKNGGQYAELVRRAAIDAGDIPPLPTSDESERRERRQSLLDDLAYSDP